MLEHIKAIQKTNQQTVKIIKQMMGTKLFANENEAFVVLRATMKTLRDRIHPQEAIHLGGQLPALLRGFYFEGWNFKEKVNPGRSAKEFISDARIFLNGHADVDLESVIPIALKAILDAIDQGEAIQVLHNLPKSIQDICPE